jgi:hypothetical protein
MAALEDWIGREVTAGVNVAGGMYTGVLEGVDDRGIVLLHEVGIQAPAMRPVFYPWRLVTWVYPTSEDEPGSVAGTSAEVPEEPAP